MILFFTMLCGFVLQIAPFGFLCFYPFANHLRFSKRKMLASTSVGILVLGLLFASACCHLDAVVLHRESLFLYANVVFLACLPPCLAWYLYSIQEIWQKKLYIFTFNLTTALAMTFISNAIDAKTRAVRIASGLPYDPVGLAILFIVTLLVVPLLWLLLKQLYMPVADGLSRKESGFLAMLSLLLFAMLASGLISVDYAVLFQPKTLLLYSVLLVAVFSIYFICFKLFYHAHKGDVAQRNIVQMQHQMEINTEQHKRILDNIEISRRLRHDFHYHIIALQGFLAGRELGKAEEYLEQFATSLSEHEVPGLCANSLVNTVVGHYYTLAREKGIKFTLRLDVPRALTVQDSDLSVLLGNLLENAIAAADRATKEERRIDLNVIHSGKMLVVAVDNGFDGDTKITSGQYLSIKRDHIGLGLGSIKSIAEKYGGGVEFTHDNTSFHASVMLHFY